MPRFDLSSTAQFAEPYARIISRSLFDEARSALVSLGYSIPTYEEYLEVCYDGFLHGLRSRRAVARFLVPGVAVEKPTGIDFYISFQPMRLASKLKELTKGAVAIKNIELDPDALRWTYEYATGERATIEGKRGFQRWTAELNAHQERTKGRVRFLTTNAKYGGTKLVVTTLENLPQVRALLG
ncbi:MAG: hypothetical protein AAGE52_23490 [Myxococcota bacterium]